VKNYLSWCNVAVAGATASSAAEQIVCVPAGTTSVAATALTGFVLDPNGTWHGTDGDTGSGDMGIISNGTSTANVTIAAGTSTKCVWACCPGANNTAPCPTTNQCP
jgi:hypothetical protein